MNQSTSTAGQSPSALSTQSDPLEDALSVHGVRRAILTLQQSLADDIRRGPTWTWLAGAAARCGVDDRIRPAAVELGAETWWDRGVAAHTAGDRVRRPVSEALAARVTRLLRGMAALPADAPASDEVRIHRLVRRTAGEGRGASIDVVVGVDGVVATLHGLRGADLASYARVRGRALEEGVALPAELLAPGGWAAIVADAIEREEIERLAPGEDVDAAIAEVIQRVLAESPRTTSADGLDRGHVVEDAERLIVRCAAVIRAVQRALPDDRVARGDVARVARALGLVARPTLSDGTRPRATWAFPLAAALEPDEPAEDGDDAVVGSAPLDDSAEVDMDGDDAVVGSAPLDDPAEVDMDAGGGEDEPEPQNPWTDEPEPENPWADDGDEPAETQPIDYDPADAIEW